MEEKKVTIGLPVYNGEDFLAQAIESTLAQSYSNWELIISDNASTDGTEAICRAFAKQDERIKYHRAEKNLGAAWNYNRTFELATGDYFRWLAHDDMLAPTCLEKSVQVLDARPEVVLAFTWTVDIDGEGNVIRTKQPVVDSQAPAANVRFRELSWVYPAHNCEEVFGLIRTEVLAKTKLIDNYTDSDRNLLADLGLHGPFCEIQEGLFLHRIHQTSSVVVNPSRHERTFWFNPSARGKLIFPSWRQFGELILIIGRSPVDLRERLRCYWHMLNWMKKRRVFLARDLVWAARHAF